MDANTDQSLFRDNGHSHPNPMFDFLSGYVPRKLKDLFRWTEYLYYNSPHIFQALVKLSDYVLTSIEITTESDTDRARYEKLFKSLNLLPTLRACARDRMIYGNSFVSIYFPFTRWTRCPDCRSSKVLSAANYTFDLKKLTCTVTCTECDSPYREKITEMDVKKDTNRERINLIRWDPKLIDIDYNPITGQSHYYYTMPETIRDQIEDGNAGYVETIPNEFLECLAADDKVFRFQDNQIFHMKVPAPAGIDPSWGYPPITSVIKQFFYAQVLRKANEAIALDYLVPLRVLHPAQTGGTNDPFTQISLEIWKEELMAGVVKQRRDPLHMILAPVAVGVTQIGGTGRTLLTLGEVEAVESNILAGIGVPREFLFGGLSYTGSSMTLRMMENQMMTHTADLEDLLIWISNTLARELQWNRVTPSIVPFRFIDDIQQKNMLLQADSVHNFVSKRTIASQFDLEYDAEIKQRDQEVLDDARRDIELEQKLTEMQNSLSQQAAAEAQGDGGLAYDQQAVIARASEVAQQLMQLDDGTKKSHLSGLQAEDAVMYAVVIQQLEQIRTTQAAEIRAQM